MKKLLLVTAALVAAVAVFVARTVPPRRLALPAVADGAGDKTVPGIIHIHTNRSDGLSGPDEIAAAAARAGLRFVVFTDHGDATRRPDPPTYRSGVLCLDGVEISTTGGHYIALDMPASPYPLGGEARDVVEDVRRLGGFGIAAHPDSPKAELRWREWTAPIDAVELTNLDTGWRVWAQQAGGSAGAWYARRRLATALLDYPFRPTEVTASLMRPSGAIVDWESLTERRRVVSLAGADAHAKLAPRNADPGDSRYALPFPSYESSFRILSVHVRPDTPLTGVAADDAARLMRAIRAGHLYTAIDGVATPPSFEITATNEHGTVHEGDELGAGGPVTLRVRSNAPAGFTTIVRNRGRVIGTDHHEQDFTIQTTGEPAVYWIDIRSTGQPNEVSWIRSNPIYVRADEPARKPPARPPASASQPIFNGVSVEGWRVEHDRTSLAAVEVAGVVGGSELRFRYGLSGGSPTQQVAALAFDTPRGLASHTRLSFTIRAEHPMRVSVQLRGGVGEVERWQRSAYADTFDQERTIDFDDVVPVGATRTIKPPLDSIRSILFVVDLTNTKPGASGRIWIKKAALQQ